MARLFKLKRTLLYGMRGEDVRQMQKLLNIANEADHFYNGKVPENGVFDMFQTRVCLTKFQEWVEMNPTYAYDLETHGMLVTAANLALQIKNVPSYQWYTAGTDVPRAAAQETSFAEAA